jgi:hypothetical protein
MEELLLGLIGNKIDIVCTGGANIRGEVIKIAGGVLQLKDNDQQCYISVDKIVVVWETGDDGHRAGFVPTAFVNSK